MRPGDWALVELRWFVCAQAVGRFHVTSHLRLAAQGAGVPGILKFSIGYRASAQSKISYRLFHAAGSAVKIGLLVFPLHYLHIPGTAISAEYR